MSGTRTAQLTSEQQQEILNSTEVQQAILDSLAKGQISRFLVLGETQTGKSSLISSVMRNTDPHLDLLPEIGGKHESCTSQVKKWQAVIGNGAQLCFYDTPGLLDPKVGDEYHLLKIHEFFKSERPDAIIYVSKFGDAIANRATRETVRKFQKLFPDLPVVSVLTFAGKDVENLPLPTDLVEISNETDEEWNERIWRHQLRCRETDMRELWGEKLVKVVAVNNPSAKRRGYEILPYFNNSNWLVNFYDALLAIVPREKAAVVAMVLPSETAKALESGKVHPLEHAVAIGAQKKATEDWYQRTFSSLKAGVLTAGVTAGGIFISDTAVVAATTGAAAIYPGSIIPATIVLNPATLAILVGLGVGAMVARGVYISLGQ